ncbi:MAG TPA: Gfo/Idh/MocA family oxidoreductase [Phycisphaeraceae bacterium]
MQPIRVGVIGCGAISDQYFRFASQYPILKVAACADLDAQRALSQAAKYGVPCVCTSVDELLADESVELVVNLTTPDAHAPIALRAIEAGKHVYNEKPLAITPAEGRALLEAARARGVHVGCAPDTFLGTAHQTCRRLIDQGVIGQPIAATAFMLSRGPEHWHPNPVFYYQPGGGPMFDMGPYYLTALINLLGPITTITGLADILIPQRIITSKPKYGQEIRVQTPDHITGSMRFACGACATIITSFAVHHPTYERSHPITLYGTEGTMMVPDPNGFDGEVRIRLAGESEWRVVEPCHRHPNGRSLGVAEMAHALRTRREPRASGRLALAVLHAMQAFLDASTTHQAQTLPADYDRPPALPHDDGFLTSGS